MNLDRDLERLRTEYGIDDTMIQSLKSTSNQAKDHLAFWKRCMWAVNGTLLVIGIIGMLFVARWLLETRAMIAGIVFLVVSIAVLKVSSVLLSQKRALAAIEEVAERHNLM